jgi:hypothetical protein
LWLGEHLLNNVVAQTRGVPWSSRRKIANAHLVFWERQNRPRKSESILLQETTHRHSLMNDRPMEKQFNHSANRICMSVVETFEAVKKADGSSMWFTPELQIFVTLDESRDAVLFTFANDSFTTTRDTIATHCRAYRSSLAASQ